MSVSRPLALRSPRQRLAPENRRRQIIDAAISYFAEVGFDGGTRELARRLGVTQPLIYRYFPSKEDLIRAVYEQVYLTRWQPDWERLLADPAVPIRDRLLDFYGRYCEAIFTPEWLRIYLFAGLRGLEINRWWMTFVEHHLLRRIAEAIRAAHGYPLAEIGGSMAGLFTALLLRQRGWDVHVAERAAAPLSGRGAGIVTHKQLWRILETLGLDPHTNFGVLVRERVTLAQDGEVVGRYDCPQTMTSWDRLFYMLYEQWPDDRYAPGMELRDVTQDGPKVRALFADGSIQDADLLVGADGFRSSVRVACMGQVTPQYAGYTAWRGLVAEADLPARVHADLFGRFSFCLPVGEQMLGYPVAGETNDLRPGHRRYNFVWYRPADEAEGLPRLLTDATGRLHAVSIPPPLIRPSLLAEMRQDAERILAPQFAAIVRATPQPFLQPIYDLETPIMAQGRVALVGDSAFVARPHVGAGVTKAAEDAAALAEALEATSDVPAALLQYQTRRLPEGRRVVQRARHLGAYMQARLRTGEEQEAAARHRTPEAVMAETAQLNF